MTPELSPAYDFVATVPYLPDDRLALNLAGEKDMNSIDLTHFKKLTRKAGVPERLVLNEVQETVVTVLEQWDKNKRAYDLPLALRERIDVHMKKVSLSATGQGVWFVDRSQQQKALNVRPAKQQYIRKERVIAAK